MSEPLPPVYVRIDFLVPDREDAYERLIDLAARMNASEHSGWARRSRSDIRGRVWVVRIERDAAEETIYDIFGKTDADLSVTDDPDAPAKVRTFGSFRILKPAITVRERRASLDSIDHRGTVRGWAVDPESEGGRLEVEIRMDGAAIGSTVANRLQISLLERGIGDGEHGFEFRIPEDLLDGRVHTIEVADPLGNSSRPLTGTTRRELQLPERFSIDPRQGQTSAPQALVDSGALLRFHALRERIAAGEGETAMQELRDLWNAHPELVFQDAKLLEATRLAGSTFLNYRERLCARLAGWTYRLVCGLGRDCCKLSRKPWSAEESIARCPQLIRRFTSKAFIKEYAAAAGIPTAKTLLVSNSFEEISAYPLPDRFVIKPDVGTKKCTFVYSDGFDLFSRRPVTKEEILASVQEFMRQENDPYFVIEEVLMSRRAGNVPSKPIEYGVYVFGERARVVRAVDRNVFESQEREYSQQGYFSSNWVPAPQRMRNYAEYLNNFAPPKRLDDMLAIASRVGRDCGAAVRVDFYDQDDAILMGEITTFAARGRGFTEFGDLVMSQLWEAFPDREVPLYQAKSLPARGRKGA